jgi:hypothetical protein
VKTTGVAIGLISDWHSGGVGDVGFHIPEWYAAQDPKPIAILHAGDVCSFSGSAYAEFVEKFTSAGLPVPMSCLGNHDFDVDVTSSTEEAYPAGASPIDGDVAAAMPEASRFPYWRTDVGPVRVLFLDNCYDTTIVTAASYYDETLISGPNYYQCYGTDNPPGRLLGYWQAHGFPSAPDLQVTGGNPNGTNPEYAGWVTSGWIWRYLGHRHRPPCAICPLPNR